MKKFSVTMFLLLVLCLGLPWAALAAEVPVYLEGERVATAVERGGYTYLPLRTMFETLGADVKWQAANQTIEADMPANMLPEGGTLCMQVGSLDAILEFRELFAYSPHYTLEKAPYISRGTVYVPLRFVTEDVMQFDVKWRGGAVYLTAPKLTYEDGADVYTLTQYTGELFLAENGGQSHSLGVCQLPGYFAYQPVGVMYELKVVKTEMGNYLVKADGMLHSEPSHWLRWYAWLNADSGVSYSGYDYADSWEDFPAVAAGGGKVLLNNEAPNQNRLLIIDEPSGKMTGLDIDSLFFEQGLSDEYMLWDCLWTNGQYILAGCLGNYIIYDLSAERGIEITSQLLTDELKAKVQDLLLTKGYSQSVDDYWSMLGYKHILREFANVPLLEFLGAENGELNFKLICNYHDNSTDSRASQEYPLSISLEQIKELIK